MNLRKTEKTVIFIVVLASISALSAGLISVVYSVTKPRVDAIRKQALVDAANTVLPESDEVLQKNFQPDGSEELKNYFVGKKDGKITGYAFSTESSRGYGGKIELLMGIDSECKVTSFQMIHHAETPGLGDQVERPFFKNQFVGKYLGNFNFKVKQDGGDVDAVTAATITSRAVTEALESGLREFTVCK